MTIDDLLEKLLEAKRMDIPGQTAIYVDLYEYDPDSDYSPYLKSVDGYSYGWGIHSFDLNIAN